MTNKIKKVAIITAQKAGQLLLKEYNKFRREDIKLKSKHEIITKADLMSERYIIKEIKRSFPDHQILSEESGKTKNASDYLWIVDPLDGTTNFSIHNPMWAVSIAVAYKNKIMLGVIFAPFLGELFVAQKSSGAMLNNKKIAVSRVVKDKAIHTFCHGSTEKDTKRAVKYYSYQKLRGLDCRQLGSASLELAYVAAGRIESIMIPGANPWDVAAGVLLVREAGGTVTDFAGKKWALGSKDMLASNRMVHKKVLRVINTI